MDAKFKVTDEWIARHASKGGGWTAKQMACLGLAWPPRKGWREAVAGKLITQEQRMGFETGARVRRERDLRSLF